MSLLDVFLLEPCRVNVWVAARTDGIAGSGTLSDPYNGSTAALFDELMNDFAAQVTETTGVRVNLGPGLFQTAGYYDGTTGGWQAVSRMKIVGSGVDVTTLQLVSAAPNGKQCFAVGHALGASTEPADFFEISDLTIDCNLSGQTNSVAAGAVRVKGSHTRLRRIKAVGWGTRTTSAICHVLSAVTADAGATPPGIFDAVIDECLVIEPSNSWISDGTGVALHLGHAEVPSVPRFPEATGESGVIRNCFVDGTFIVSGAPVVNLSRDIRAVSVSGCQKGVSPHN